MKSRKYYTNQDLCDIWFDKQTTRKITPSEISRIKRDLMRYINHDKTLRNKNKNYIKAARDIIRWNKEKKTKSPKNPVEQESLLTSIQEPAPDSYARLKTAYAAFEDALAEFIKTEVSTQHTALIEENKRLREENERMNDEFTKAKNSNWVDSIRKSLTH